MEQALREAFRPEFLNRIDDTIVFRALTKEDLMAIVELQLARCARAWPSGRSRWW